MKSSKYNVRNTVIKIKLQRIEIVRALELMNKLYIHID